MATHPRLVNKQFNSPIGLYSEQNIKDVIDRDSQILANGAVGINFNNPGVGKPANLQNSAVLRMLEEEENRQRNGQIPGNHYDSSTNRANFHWPPRDYENKNKIWGQFKDVVVPGVKRVAWPPPNYEGIPPQNPEDIQGGPPYTSQSPTTLPNNSASIRQQQVSNNPPQRQPLPPLNIGTAQSPVSNSSPITFRPSTPNKPWASVQSPISPQYRSTQQSYQSPQQQYQPTQQYQSPQQQYQQPQRQYQFPQQQYQPSQEQYQSPQQQYQQPQYQYQSPQQQYQSPQHQNQSPQQQYQTPQQQYQSPQQQYQSHQQQYQTPQQQYQSPQQQYQPSQQQKSSQQYQSSQHSYQSSQQYKSQVSQPQIQSPTPLIQSPQSPLPSEQQYKNFQQQYLPRQQVYQQKQKYQSPQQQNQQLGQQSYQTSSYQQSPEQVQYHYKSVEHYQSPPNQSCQEKRETVREYTTTKYQQSYQQSQNPNQSPAVQSVAAQNQVAAPQQRPQNSPTNIKNEPPPTTITLRPQAPVSQIPAPVVTSQPATATFKGGKHLRGDMKWPPENVKRQMEEEQQHLIELAKGPACRPTVIRRDYGPFFAQHALNQSYPGYKVPPGTQFYENKEQW